MNSTYPATSSGYANAVSTPVNMVWDTSLVAWTHNSRIYYKRSGYSYAYKQSPNPDATGSVKLKIWPNPTEEHLMVNNEDNVVNRYTIKNILGQVISTGSINEGINILPIKTLATGSYFMHFYKDRALVSNQMFVKK